MVTSQRTDALGRLRLLEEEVTPGHSVATDLEYDHEDRLNGVRLWQGERFQSPEQRRRFVFSGAGFLISSEEPERTVLYTGYDARGELMESTSDGVTTWLGHDLVGRVVSRRANGTEVAWWVWGDDQPGGGAGLGEPSYGRIVRAFRHNRFGGHDVGVKTIWSYLGPGARVSSRALSVDGVGQLGEALITEYAYDRWGRTSAVAHPRWTGWGPVCQDVLTERRSNLDEWLVGADAVVETAPVAVAGMWRTFLPTGRVAEAGLSAGGVPVGSLRQAPDPHGMARAADYQLWWADQGTLWSEGPYGYDGSGNVARIGARGHAHDGLDRLVAVAEAGQLMQGFDYDRWGNLAEIRDHDTAHGGGFTLRLPGAEDDNRPAAMEVVGSGSHPLGWDGRGNLTTIPATQLGREKSLHYSADDRLMEVVDTASGTIWRYAYDAEGERVLSWRSDGAGDLTEVRLHPRDEGGSVLSDWLLVPGSSFATVRDYLTVGGRLAIQLDYGPGGPAPLFAAHDHLGSTRALVRVDGTVADLLEYHPYGTLRSGGPVPGTGRLFTGHERDLGDTTSELDYMHARHYSPMLGRFTSIDSAIGDPASSQSWNRYAYTAGNPLRAVDPDGRYRSDVHFNLTKALAVAVGYSDRQAVGIAAADQNTDKGVRSSTSLAGILRGSTSDYHFTTVDRRRELADTARESGLDWQLGRYVHALQDSYSHAGYGSTLGHLFAGKAPDVTANDPAKAMRMARATYNALVDFRGDGQPLVDFSEIEGLVESFVRLPEREEEKRLKILAEVEELARARRAEED